MFHAPGASGVLLAHDFTFGDQSPAGDHEAGEAELLTQQTGDDAQWPETLGLAAVADAGLVRSFADTVRREYRGRLCQSAISRGPGGAQDVEVLLGWAVTMCGAVVWPGSSTGLPPGSMVTMVWKSCPAFSSSVMRPSRSVTRSSMVQAGSWYGCAPETGWWGVSAYLPMCRGAYG